MESSEKWNHRVDIYNRAGVTLVAAIIGYIVVAVFAESIWLRLIAAGAAALDINALRLYKRAMEK